MNFRHALGFLGVGFLAHQLPQSAPLWVGGSATGLLWLQFMSWVLIGIGAIYLLGRATVTAGSLLAYTPPLPAELIPAATPARTVPLRSAAPRTPRRTPAAVPAHDLPAALPTALLEQQRAA